MRSSRKECAPDLMINEYDYYVELQVAGSLGDTKAIRLRLRLRLTKLKRSVFTI